MAARVLLRAINDGASPCFLADLRDDNGPSVPFFGRPARSTVFPALLARTTGVPLYAGAAFRRPGSRFSIRIVPISMPQTNNSAADALVATQALQRQYEAFIREAPEQLMRATESGTNRASAITLGGLGPGPAIASQCGMRQPPSRVRIVSPPRWIVRSHNRARSAQAFSRSCVVPIFCPLTVTTISPFCTPTCAAVELSATAAITTPREDSFERQLLGDCRRHVHDLRPLEGRAAADGQRLAGRDFRGRREFERQGQLAPVPQDR